MADTIARPTSLPVTVAEAMAGLSLKPGSLVTTTSQELSSPDSSSGNSVDKIVSPIFDDDLGLLGDTSNGAWWTPGDHIIPEHLIESVDQNVKALMPPNTEIVSIGPHGISTWTRTAEIQTKLDGKPVSYFIKVTDMKPGKIMFPGEVACLKTISDAMPGFCPTPLGWGHYASDPNVHFFLCEFIDMLDEPMDPDLLPEKVAEMHKKAPEPDGLYGFPVVIAGGVLPVCPARSKSWEDYFWRYMRYLFKAEEISQGPPPPKMARLLDILFNRIIPRLLRPLETGGREIIPRLLHSDLWDGNMATNSEGSPVIFDPSCMYGHNEMDLGVWTNPRMVTGVPFINSYHNFFERSAPEEDHYGRNILYALAFEARVSAILMGNDLFRNEIIRYITELDEKFPESYEEWARARGEEVCSPKVDSGIRWESGKSHI